MNLRYLIPCTAVFAVLLHINIYLHSMAHGYGNVNEHANFVWTFACWTILFGVVSVIGWIGRLA